MLRNLIEFYGDKVRNGPINIFSEYDTGTAKISHYFFCALKELSINSLILADCPFLYEKINQE